MIVTAKFIGSDGDLGYRTGHIYILNVRGRWISRQDGSGQCPYSTISSFLQNWEHVKVSTN